MTRPYKLLVLIGSPRRNGNSAALAEAAQSGAQSVGIEVSVRFVDDYISSFLRGCRECRTLEGTCSINDQYRTLFLDDYLPADGVIFCSPVYWYGLSAQVKAFLDRSFCYYAASYPESAKVIAGMVGKRIGLLLSSEEVYPGAILGIVHQIQEFSRYTRSEFVGVVRGVGNSRGEIAHDPTMPLRAAEELGRSFFMTKYSDYRIETERSGRVWQFDLDNYQIAHRSSKSVAN